MLGHELTKPEQEALVAKAVSVLGNINAMSWNSFIGGQNPTIKDPLDIMKVTKMAMQANFFF